MSHNPPGAPNQAASAALPSLSLGSLNIAVVGQSKLGMATRILLKGASAGEGYIAVREVFAGIRLLLVDVHDLPRDAVVALAPSWRAWCLLHCQRGDCSCHAEDGASVHPLAGQVALLNGQGRAMALHVHEGRLRGMALVVDDEGLTRDVSMVMRSFFGIDARAIRDRLSEGTTVRLLPESANAAHVFIELYFSFAHSQESYLRLKVFELLSLYTQIQGRQDPPSGRKRRSSSASGARHAAIAMHAQEVMVRDLSQPHTVPELARECGTSPTVLKESYREVFGIPVYSWLRVARVHRAVELMESEPERSIASIATEVGYANPSKFAKAFGDVMGTTPSAFRRSMQGR